MDFIEGAGITAPAFPEGPGCSRGPGRVQAAGAGWVPDHTVDLHRRTRRWLGALLFLGLLGAVCGTAGAAETGAARWPTRAVKLVVPFVASGSSDIMARTVGQALAGLLGQPVVIENKPGAGGNIALEYVARQPGDGYTLLFGTIGTNGINPALYRHLPYDPVRDFAPVSLLHTLPNVLIVNPDLGVHSVPALIALARAHPGDLTFASAGNGSSSHLAGELFKAAAGIDIRHVPYKGGGAAIPDMIAGRIAMMFETIPTAMAPARSGKVVALAVTTPQRSAIAPELPTMAEAGLPGFQMSSWTALFATGGTPRPIIERLNAAARQLPLDEAYRARFREMGAEAVSSTPEQLGDFVRAEIARWAEAARASGADRDLN